MKRPMFNYYGAKRRGVREYPPPRHRVIVEPFAGSAAYAVHHRRKVDRVLLFEKDERVVEIWHRLLDMSQTELRDMPLPAPGDTSTDLLIALASARTTRDTPSQFVVSSRMIQRARIMLDRIAAVVPECQHFEVRLGDYREAPDIEATWFIDPPYQCRGGRWDRSRGGRYAHSNRDLDYAELGDWARGRHGQVIVCEQTGADWLPWNGSARARSSSHDLYAEVWWTSDPPEQPDLFEGVV